MQFISSSLASSENAANTAPNPITGFIPLIVIFAIFYLLLIRPQQKKLKDHKLMLSELKAGDKVISSGGIIGKILKIEEEIISLEISEGITVKIMRSYISEKLQDKQSLLENSEKKNSKKKPEKSSDKIRSDKKGKK